MFGFKYRDTVCYFIIKFNFFNVQYFISSSFNIAIYLVSNTFKYYNNLLISKFINQKKQLIK